MRYYSNLDARLKKAHDELIAQLADLVGASYPTRMQVLEMSVNEIKTLKAKNQALESMLHKSCSALYEIAELLGVNAPDESLVEIVYKVKKELERREK